MIYVIYVCLYLVLCVFCEFVHVLPHPEFYEAKVSYHKIHNIILFQFVHFEYHNIR